jgi:hypothetical protein
VVVECRVHLPAVAAVLWRVLDGVHGLHALLLPLGLDYGHEVVDENDRHDQA